MSVVGENVVFRQRVAETVGLGEAGEGAQILGIGPQGAMSDAALIAAGIDESGVIETGHAELLKMVFRQFSTGLTASRNHPLAR
jgi:hypothetical protein